MGEAEVLAILRKYGTTITPEALTRALPELNAMGVYVQNQQRGDVRPRIILPDKNTVDLGDFGGPWQWVFRGDYGDWHSAYNQGSDPGADPGTNPNAGPGDPGWNTTQGDGSQGSPIVSGTLQGVPIGTNMMQAYLASTPGYQFAFNEGQRAVQTSAAARGTLLTGGTLKALAKFGTGLADQTYDAATKRFLSLADLGARTAVAPY